MIKNLAAPYAAGPARRRPGSRSNRGTPSIWSSRRRSGDTAAGRAGCPTCIWPPAIRVGRVDHARQDVQGTDRRAARPGRRQSSWPARCAGTRTRSISSRPWWWRSPATACRSPPAIPAASRCGSPGCCATGPTSPLADADTLDTVTALSPIMCRRQPCGGSGVVPAASFAHRHGETDRETPAAPAGADRAWAALVRSNGLRTGASRRSARTVFDPGPIASGHNSLELGQPRGRMRVARPPPRVRVRRLLATAPGVALLGPAARLGRALDVRAADLGIEQSPSRRRCRPPTRRAESGRHPPTWPGGLIDERDHRIAGRQRPQGNR